MEVHKLSASDFIIEKKGRLREVYRIGNKLGEGIYGYVRQITHRITGEVRAVKVIYKSSIKNEHERESFFNEVSVLRTLDHPNIIKLYEYYQDYESYYLITEYCSGGELFEKIINHGSFSEAIAANYMCSILSVINYCHSRNIIHRDLKPENFLLDSNAELANLKVIGFGSSIFFTPGQHFSEQCGIAYFMAPEVVNRQYNETCDIWSAGINMFLLLCGYPPFGGTTDDQIMKKICRARFSFPSPEWDYISFEAKDLISKLLAPNADERISIQDSLQHPWLTSASLRPINTTIAKGIFSNLQNFKSEQKLQKATYIFISSQLITKKEREELLGIFKSLDTDKSGTLSRKELIEGFGLLYPEDFNDIEAEVDKIMSQVDIDGSGEIDYSEFVAASMKKKRLLSRERLEAAFNNFDIDRSGTITADELKALLGKRYLYGDHVWAEIIKEADQNGDGVIDFKEFCDMMLKFN